MPLQNYGFACKMRSAFQDGFALVSAPQQAGIKRRIRNVSDFAKKWGDEYNKCIQPLQGKGSRRMPEQLAVVSGSAPLLKALVGIDKNDPSALKAGSEREKVHKALQKEVKAYTAAASKYSKLFDAAIKKTPKDDKEAYRALKKLKSHLDMISAQVEHHMTTTSKANIKASDKSFERVEKETKKARDKGMDDEAVKKEVDYAKQLRSLVQFPTAVKAAYTKATAAVQTIKSDPSPETYNKEMFAGGRNYTQQVGNLIKLSKDSKCPPKVKDILKGLNAYKSQLDAYGNGDRRRIPTDTSEKDVMAYLKTFARLIKDTYPYAQDMQAYLKKHKIK